MIQEQGDDLYARLDDTRLHQDARLHQVTHTSKTKLNQLCNSGIFHLMHLDQGCVL